LDLSPPAGYNHPIGTRRRVPFVVRKPAGRSQRRARSAVQVTVSVRHGTLDDTIREELKEKGEKLLHYFNRLTMIEITVDQHRGHDGNLSVEIRATAEHKHEFVGTDAADGVLAAFHKAAAHIKQQITHYKEKLQDHRRDTDFGGNNGAR
jgi:putative sigma-54 modulation protein